MVYNTLLVKYKNSWQLRTYEFPIKCENENDTKFENVEDEIDKAFSVLDNEYHFEGRSAYVSINRSKNKIFYYARSNNWTGGYFVTFTINPDKYNSFDYKVCSRLVQLFFKRLYKYDRSIYALLVPEKHQSGAYHFHGIISSGLKDLLVDSLHRYNKKIIYNCPMWKYGFSNVTEVQNTLAIEKYITKYTTKELLNDTLYQHRYFTLNLQEADMLRMNLYNHKELFKELIFNGCVLYNNTDGLYNRCTYTEIKNDKKTLQIIEKYINITKDLF